MHLVLAIFALLGTVDAAARVLVEKDFISMYPVANQENVYEYHLVNIGDTSAVDVVLSDRDSFPTDRFEVLKGSLDARFAVILPNATASHHIIVAPRISQPILEADVVVDYTDSETKKVSRVTTTWYNKGRFTHYLNKEAIRNLNGSTAMYFVCFGALTVPVTAMCALLYAYSKRRYSTIKKHN
ncbi:hypothetical protein CAEBREN_29022 [Caenorhabditis brenneri]|uniref:Translocon-associated protein subunit beta n=1 Tax=Caenorhabditis brenneri TaxID=135651 RepID=G0PJI7_CAEBE|nr:hypothetical protein CAEBREN_29022 [Caenorhabditis brenneri]